VIESSSEKKLTPHIVGGSTETMGQTEGCLQNAPSLANNHTGDLSIPSVNHQERQVASANASVFSA
jgi:hypothetical protein